MEQNRSSSLEIKCRIARMKVDYSSSNLISCHSCEILTFLDVIFSLYSQTCIKHTPLGLSFKSAEYRFSCTAQL